MKEYLVKAGDEYVVINNPHPLAMEIPEGASEFYVEKSGDGWTNFFQKEECGKKYFRYTRKTSNWEDWNPKLDLHELVWRRPNTKEYLNPTDWTLHTVDVDNDAAGENWLLVPEGAECCNSGHIFYKDNGYSWHTGNGWRDAEHRYGDLGIKWQRHTQPEELPFIDDEPKAHNHYFINVSDVNEIDFYEIALRYNVTDPCVQHILKKCLAIGNRGHKDLITDMKDILDTAKRMLQIHGGDK